MIQHLFSKALYLFLNKNGLFSIFLISCSPTFSSNDVKKAIKCTILSKQCFPWKIYYINEYTLWQHFIETSCYTLTHMPTVVGNLKFLIASSSYLHTNIGCYVVVSPKVLSNHSLFVSSIYLFTALVKTRISTTQASIDRHQITSLGKGQKG